MPDPTEFLKTAEAARLLRLSPRTLESMRVRGGGPVFRRHGRRVVYSREDLIAWSDGQARCSTSEGAA